MDTSPRPAFRLLILPVLFAAGYFVQAVLDLRRDLVLEHRGVLATATVLDTTHHSSKCGSWCTTVHYGYAAGGASYEGWHAIPDRLRAALLAGGTLPIAYDPRLPSRAEPVAAIEHEKGWALLRLTMLPFAVLVSVAGPRAHRRSMAAGSG